jgi:3alpha(or 20beta)-hydroxysteroid dehydrogenase
VIADLLQDAGATLEAELGDAAMFFPLDVTSPGSWAEMMQRTRSRFGPVGVLVNCAGKMVVARLEDTTPDLLRSVLDVNLLGPLLGIQAVLDDMKQLGGGSVVIVSSVVGLEGSRWQGAYAASKAANANLTRTAAIELGQYGIRVNAIAPGAVDTPMSNAPEFDGVDKVAWSKQLPIPRIGIPDDMAPTVVLIASDQSRYMTGSMIKIDGGMLAGHTTL